MTISTTDLKIYRSQRNRDTEDGGGVMSPDLVVDGEINNVFDDVSSEDRVTGRVSIRKVYPGVFSDDTDKFFGAGLLIIEPAHDDAVDVVMARATRYDDERRDIVTRIESYLAPGVTLLWRLFNNHLSGTLVLTLFAPEDAPSPDVGDTIFLEDNDGIKPTEAVRVQSIVSRSTQSFFDGNGALFRRDVLALELTRPLQGDWDGTEVQRATTASVPTRMRGSSLSESARYYGVKPLEQNIAQGDITTKVASPFSAIVPSTTAEQPMTDVPAGLTVTAFEKTGADDSLSVSTPSVSFSSGVGETFYFGSSVFPGSISVSGSGTATDMGDGRLEFSGSTFSGEIDYAQGAVTIIASSTSSHSFTLTATPAAALQTATQSTQVVISEQNRNLNYIRQLNPRPAPGTVTVDYRALGNWYRLKDDRTGSLVGEQPGQGAGTINYQTGTVTATLAALPDAGTTVIFRWGGGVAITNASQTIQDSNQSGGNDTGEAPVEFFLDPLPSPGSVELNYNSGGSPVTVVDTTGGGLVLQGTATEVGRIQYGNGLVTLWDSRPDTDGNITANYSETGAASGGTANVFNPVPVGMQDAVSFNVGAGVEPGTLALEWKIIYGRESHMQGGYWTVEAYDDGDGNIIIDGRRFRGTSHDHPGGTINYATGDISINTAFQILYADWRVISYEGELIENIVPWEFFMDQGYGYNLTLARLANANRIDARFLGTGSGGSTVTKTISGPGVGTPPPDAVPTQVSLSVLPGGGDRIIPGSVRFVLNGQTYTDRMGDLVADPDVLTGFGPVKGSIDYDTGDITINDWSNGSYTLQVVSLGTQKGIDPAAHVFFRTPTAPIASQSLTISALRMDTETQISGVPDVNGIINTSEIQGFVDIENGIVEVKFGETVAAAGNEDEDWYDAANVDESGNIWKPIWVDPSTITFSALGFVSIPLDPDILGLDPILLPSDGRVPIFRKGDSVMVVQRNEVEDAAPSAGAVVSTGISNVSWARVRDANGTEVVSDLYSINPGPGELVWANPLDLATYTGPYTIEAMSYFKRLCTDVQVNGNIGLSSGAPFAMDSANGQIFLCSKLIFKPEGGTQDLQALVFNKFTQETWTDEWSNNQIGSGTTGQYDDVNFPIEIANNGSITERWRLEFTGTSTVNVIGERFGQVLTGAAIASDIAPINPATGTPYFTIRAGGWSGGWQVVAGRWATWCGSTRLALTIPSG